MARRKKTGAADAVADLFAQRGAKAGKAFWGCTGYPACRGTRALE